MYFDPTPKYTQKNLFGREYLLSSLLSHLHDEQVRLVVLKGLRRTGKTSLLNVALNEIKELVVKIDVREAPYFDRREFLQYVVTKVKEKIGESLFQKILKNISKIELSYKEMSAAFYLDIESKFITFFRDLNQELARKKKYFILAFDEVQWLSKIEFNVILAALYDNYKHIKVVVTGSEIGLIDGFLGNKDADSPLFGRAIIELEIPKLDDESITNFLRKGFGQIHQSISLQEIKDVVNNFDGIIGWATQYGWWRSKEFTHQQAILKVVEEGTKLTRKELDNFLVKRNKSTYLKILRWISRGYTRWKVLKNQFLKEKQPLSDRQLYLYLQELQNYSFIEKMGNDYIISDPLLIRALG